MGEQPFVSVLLATRNRRALLEQTLDALLVQDWPGDRYEIVVADNGSTDDTAAAVARAAARSDGRAVRYLLISQCGKSYALNEALTQARGDLLAFTDDDVIPNPDWLSSLAAALADREVQFVAGRILPNWTAPPPPWLSPALHGVLAVADGGATRLPLARGLNEHVMPIGANMAVRASVVQRVGGFRTDLGKLEGTLRTGEDHEFYLRLVHAGHRGTYEPSAVVRHRVGSERLVRSYFRRWFYQNGHDVALLEQSYRSAVRRWLDVPRHLWRQALGNVASVLSPRSTHSTRFAKFLELMWFAGYVRHTWFGERPRAGRAFAAAADGSAARAS